MATLIEWKLVFWFLKIKGIRKFRSILMIWKEIPPGSMPRSIDIIIRDELTEK